MRKVIVFLFLFSASPLVYGQIKEKSNTIDGESAHGYALTLEGNSLKGEKYLVEFLKQYGKQRKKEGYRQIKGPSFNNQVIEDEILYVSMEDKGSQLLFWAGITTSLVSKDSAKQIIGYVHNMAKDFKSFYNKKEVQRLISESETAIEYTSKQQQKELKTQSMLKTEKEENTREIERLEKLLETRKFDLQVIEQKMTNSLKSSDSLYVEIEKMKLILDKHKTKLKKIN